MAFLVGMKKNDEAEAIVARYDQNCQQVCERELEELISYWHGQLSHFQIKTPSNEFNTMINTWNAYNCFMTFIWSRAASFTYAVCAMDMDTANNCAGYSGVNPSGT